ncbi:cytochrome P450 3A19-like [Uloborus diversus]|uniref:cytochrome P450 3A19-like n=1 Tax=Uloborus diversus TaxID=327109 RepID=UPI002409C89B|nr:cytochrome P450 3A19-like [Uloborus diversus]
MLQLLMDVVNDVSNEKYLTQNLEPVCVEDQEDQYGSIISKDGSHNIKHKKLTEDEMIAQCVSFFTAGFETTALTLSYVAYSLALNPDCQEKLIQEIDSAFESHKVMNYDAVRDMKYLDCVISETLRMYPPSITVQRSAAENYVVKDLGLTIEKGVIINIPVYSMHFDPEFFPEPEKFKPERFLERSHPQYAYLPFGAGPRNCLGMRFALMQIKMCMSNILRHYRFRLADNTKVPIEFNIGSVFLTVNELPLKIEKRNDL